MKRFFGIALAAALCLCFFVTATAETVEFRWNGGSSIQTFYDVNVRTFGDGIKDTIFFVYSHGSGKIVLKQTKGTCTELSYTKPVSGILGRAEEWGKYNITVWKEYANQAKTYEWDDTYNNDSITLKFPDSGWYIVLVHPFTTNEMSNSYLMDVFAGWEEPPTWWVSSNTNCSYDDDFPYGTGGYNNSSNGNTNGGSNSSNSGSNNHGGNNGGSNSSNGGNSSSSPIGNWCTIIGGVVNCRTGAGSSYSTEEYVHRGDRFCVYDVGWASNGTKWYQINVGGNLLWISAEWALVDGDPNGIAIDRNRSPVDQKCTITSSTVACYDGAGYGYNICAYLNSGDICKVHKVKRGSDGWDWYQVYVGSRYVWIPSDSTNFGSTSWGN